MPARSAIETDLDTTTLDMPANQADMRVDVFGPQGETVASIPFSEQTLTVGQAPGNQIVLDGPTVGRFHLRLVRDGDRVLVTDLGSRGGTSLDEARLMPQAAREWADGSTIRIGEYRLRLVRNRSAATRGSESAADHVDLRLEHGRETLELTPGQSTVAVVVLANHSDHEVRRTLEIDGLPEAWVELPHRELTIPAEGQISVPLRITVPRSASSRAGEYGVAILAHSKDPLADTSMATARWTVLPFEGSTLEARPHKRSVRGQRSAIYNLLLHNAGNVPASYVLHAGDDEPGLDYQLDTPRLTLDPGADANIRLTVQPRENPTSKIQNYSFSVQAQSGEQSPIAEALHLSQTRPLPLWPIPVAALLLLAIGLGWLLTRPVQANSVAAGGPVDLREPTAVSTAAPTAMLDLSNAVSLPSPTTDLNALLAETQSAINTAAQQQAAASASNPAMDSVNQSLQQVQTQVAQVASLNASVASSGNGSSGNNGSGSGGGNSGSGNSGDTSSGSTGSSAPVAAVAPSSTPAPTLTPSLTPTPTPTNTPTNTPTITPSPTNSPTNQPTNTPTNTPTHTPTQTPTATTTATATNTPTATSTATATATPTNTATPTIAPAARLRFVQEPGQATGGRVFGNQPQIRVEDTSGNLVPSYSGNVTLSIQNNGCATAGRTGTLSGTLTVAVDSGIASFNDLSINCAGNGYTLRASASGVSPQISSVFTVNIGPVDHLAFLYSPSNTRADATLREYPVVQAVDAGANLVSTFRGTINVAITGGSGHPDAQMSGVLAKYTSNGEVTYFDLAIDHVGSYTLTATSGGYSGISDSFNITATELRFASSPGNTPAGASLGSVTVEATDRFGVRDTTFTSLVTLALLNGPAGVTLQPNASPTATAIAGLANFGSTMHIDRVGQGYKLYATGGGLTSNLAAFTAFNITANQLRFISSPGNTRAGASLGAISVEATDSGGNRDITFTANVELSLTGGPGGVTLQPNATPNVAAVAGVATFSNSMHIDRIGQDYALQATSGALTGTSTAFNITASELRFISSPGNTRAGASLGPISVEATDGSGNRDTTFTGVVTLALINAPGGVTLQPNATPSATASAGVATFSSSMHVDRTWQNYAIYASSGSISGTSPTFNISASELRFTSSPGNTQAGANLGAINVYATDSNGFIDLTFNGTVTLSLTGGPGGVALQPNASPSVAATNGFVSFGNTNHIDRVGQNYVLQATSGSLSASSPSFNITANQLRIIHTVANHRANENLGSLSVRATDNSGTVDTTFNSVITLGLTGGNGSATLENGTTSLAATAGVATFSPNLRISYVGQNYRITATNGVLSATPTGAFTISADRVFFTQAPIIGFVNVGIFPQPVVAIGDGHGTIDTFSVLTVALTLNGPASAQLLPAANTSATTVNGFASFSGLFIDKTGSFTLTASSSGLGSNTSASFTVNP